MTNQILIFKSSSELLHLVLTLAGISLRSIQKSILNCYPHYTGCITLGLSGLQWFAWSYKSLSVSELPHNDPGSLRKNSEHSVAHICVPYLSTFVDVYVYINYSGTYSVRPDCGWFEVNRTPYHGVKVFMATLAWHLSKTPLSHGACSCLSNMLEELVHLTLYYLKTNSQASHESGSSCELNSLEKKLNLVLRTVNYAYH